MFVAADIRFVRRVVRSALRGFPGAEIDEIAQDVFIVLCALGEDVRPALVREIARKKCANWRRRRRELLDLDGTIEAHRDLSPDPHDRIEAKERQMMLAGAARRALGEGDLEIFRLRWLRDLEPSEIASVALPRARGDIRVALQRISRRLRSEIQRQEATCERALAGTRPRG